MSKSAISGSFTMEICVEIPNPGLRYPYEIYVRYNSTYVSEITVKYFLDLKNLLTEIIN